MKPIGKLSNNKGLDVEGVSVGLMNWDLEETTGKSYSRSCLQSHFWELTAASRVDLR